MHYSQHSEVRSNSQKKSGKLHSAIEKAQAIQQREQLQKVVLDKLHSDFGCKGNKDLSKIVTDHVCEYFEKEKVTEESLRQLKSKVAEAVGEYRKNHRSSSVKSGSAKGSQTCKK